jgi:small subunit ribosomal protein S11
MGKKKIIQQNPEELAAEKEKAEAAVKKEVSISSSQRRITEGKVYITASFNNVIVTLTDNSGNVLTWISSGNIGFKGSKKATPFAASKVAEGVADRAKKMGIERVSVLIKGVGSGRESAIRSLITHGLDITSIKDVTPIPHNGCRAPKTRRV